jgi:hypothetical protein
VDKIEDFLLNDHSQEAPAKLMSVKEESTGGKFVRAPAKDAKKKKTKKAHVEIEFETEEPARQRVLRK